MKRSRKQWCAHTTAATPPFFAKQRFHIDARFDIEKLLPGFETENSVKERLKQRINVLLGSSKKRDLALHDILSRCSRKTPCYSAACPVCYRTFRKWFYQAVASLADGKRNARMVTVLFYSEMMTNAELRSFDPTRLHNRLRKQLARAGFKQPVIGGLELDYHTESQRWLPHYHLLTFEKKAARERLRSTLKKTQRRGEDTSATISKPMLVQKLNDPAQQLSYLAKSYSSQVRAWHSTKRKTAKTRLGAREERLILNLKHSADYPRLLFLYKARRRGSVIEPSVSTSKSTKGRGYQHN